MPSLVGSSGSFSSKIARTLGLAYGKSGPTVAVFNIHMPMPSLPVPPHHSGTRLCLGCATCRTLFTPSRAASVPFHWVQGLTNLCGPAPISCMLSVCTL